VYHHVFLRLSSSHRENAQGILSMTLDGMDTAKFRVPRNIAMTKEFSEMTRAELKLTGIIPEVTSESYYLVSDAAAKDANLGLTLRHQLSETLSWFRANGRAPPEQLRIHSDNAMSEAKNQVSFFWSSFLLA
jgi:hypothetical protein